MNYRIDRSQHKIRFIFLGVFLCGFFALSSCHKEKPTIVLISVKQSSNTPVANANVHLYGAPNNSSPQGVLLIDLYAQTDANGTALFNLSEFYNQGQTGFAVLNVSAQKENSFTESYIDIIEEETNEQIIFL